MIDARRKRFLERLPMPAELRFIKQTDAARRPCPVCGRRDRAVTTRQWITYYGPAQCGDCGHVRGLRALARWIDLKWLREQTGLKSDAAYRSAWRERLEVFGPGPIPGRVYENPAALPLLSNGETIKQTETHGTNPGPGSNSDAGETGPETQETEAHADAGPAIDAA
jgi:hypothetical protein